MLFIFVVTDGASSVGGLKMLLGRAWSSISRPTGLIMII
jgi:hypothetical protein